MVEMMKDFVRPGQGAGPPPGRVAEPAPPLGMIHFVDGQAGWAGGPGVILATSDGRANWQRQYQGPAAGQALEFVDRRHGWAVAEDRLLFTADGGARWAEAPQPRQYPAGGR